MRPVLSSRRPPVAAARALRFVLLIGTLSFFADFTYEGARSVLGPFLAGMQASAVAVGWISGGGELAGYGLRLLSGRLADATRRFWPITIFGYVLQMASVPALALAHSWQAAAVLIILERTGKAIRNPPRDVMLSQAGEQLGGYGWAFGVNEALDQFGALCGPLLVAAMMTWYGDYRRAFAVLIIPAALNLAFLALARWAYPRAAAPDQEPEPSDANAPLSARFWRYLIAAGLVAAGFADYPLIAYHFTRAGSVPGADVALFYAAAMATSGTASLALGRLYDRYGMRVLAAATLVCAAFSPLVFLGGFWSALVGMLLWGAGMGVHESIIPAAVAPMVPAARRASAFGLFTAAYGVCWFVGSGVIGVLYHQSALAAMLFCVIAQVAAVPAFMRLYDSGNPTASGAKP